MPIISKAVKRRLEHVHTPTHPVQDVEHHASIATLERMVPQRPKPTSSDKGSRQVERSLPLRVVTDDNFDDAYADFIMYCNPAVAPDTDTSELRKIFRAPPKSDGKSFSTFRLFELIGKLERKELKTWAQLALDLGVVPPSPEKGQSTQKVQQYSVRLKVSHISFSSLLDDSSKGF